MRREPLRGPHLKRSRFARLSNKGIKGVRSIAQGVLLCHVVVEIPVNLTERQKERLREFFCG